MQTHIFFSPFLYQKKTSKGLYFLKNIRLCLKLKSDYFLLLFVCLSSLKVQQGLLIDFASFPQKFIDLLNLCNLEQDSDNPRYEQMLFTMKSSQIIQI